MIKTYQELEELRKIHRGEVCIFGAGRVGRYEGYELIKAAGFQVDFYCDNHIAEDTVIRDGIKIRNIQYLSEKKEDILVFLCMGRIHCDPGVRQVAEQLKELGVQKIIEINLQVTWDILASIDVADASVKKRYAKMYDDEQYLKYLFKYKMGYELNLDNPGTFNEKIQWLKLYDRKPEYINLVDKCEFKKYIEAELGAEYVIPTLGVWDFVEKIEWDKLPNEFVIKCTHDSGSVIICKNKNEFDIEGACEKLKKALERNIYWIGREWQYKYIKPRVIAEELLKPSSGEIIDYKLMCYGGVYKSAFTCTERFADSGLKVTFFDTNWNKLSIRRVYPISEKDIDKPKRYDEMIKIAEKVSKNIPFARVDFYEIDDRIYLGEITLHPGCGFEMFERIEDDILMGEDIVIGERE